MDSSNCDLKTAIGIAAPSLYAFGSKIWLSWNGDSTLGGDDRALDAAAQFGDALAGAVQVVFQDAVRAVTHPDREQGCMIFSGMIVAKSYADVRE